MQLEYSNERLLISVPQEYRGARGITWSYFDFFVVWAVFSFLPFFIQTKHHGCEQKYFHHKANCALFKLKSLEYSLAFFFLLLIQNN